MSFTQYYFKEKEETDIKFRNQANFMYNKLLSYIDNIENENVEVTKKGDLIIELGVIYKISPVSENNWAFGFGKFNGEYKPIVILSLLEESIKDFTINKDFLLKELKEKKGYIIHELIHYFDFLRAGNKDRWKDNKYNIGLVKTAKDYYNHPIEMNAYYQEAIEKIRKGYTKKILKDVKNVNNFIKPIWIMYFDKAFKDNLTDANKNRINKRLADLYITLKKEYGLDDKTDIN